MPSVWHIEQKQYPPNAAAAMHVRVQVLGQWLYCLPVSKQKFKHKTTFCPHTQRDTCLFILSQLAGYECPKPLKQEEDSHS